MPQTLEELERRIKVLEDRLNRDDEQDELFELISELRKCFAEAGLRDSFQGYPEDLDDGYYYFLREIAVLCQTRRKVAESERNMMADDDIDSKPQIAAE